MSDVVSFANNLAFLDELYTTWLTNPQAVDASWRGLFEGGLTPPEAPISVAPPAEEVAGGLDAAAVANLVRAYRVRGHLEASLDPLGADRRTPHAELDPHSYGFADADYDRSVRAGIMVGAPVMTLRELVARLRTTYCGTIGVEFMHISSPERRRWLQERMEPALNRPSHDAAQMRHTLDRLIQATELERFLHAQYVGTKRFSLEGGESLIPLLDHVVERSAAAGVEEVVFGMAHRGRLNVMTNILGMPPETLMTEFEDIDPETTLGAGDVKYHLGYSNDQVTRAGKRVHMSLTFNPSHLEAVDPVVVGRVRAKQRRRVDIRHAKVLGVLIHGDAAFAGQGLVAETLNLSDLRGYRTGGTVHVIINNQIGFTTPPTASRSTPYPTDVAKMIQVPIFHVNGDDPDSVIFVTDLAMEYRQRFETDVVLDLYCFRKYGHNEADEPSFTQPLLYERIRKHPAIYEMYGERLVRAGVITKVDLDARVRAHHQALEAGLASARKAERRPSVQSMGGVWQGYFGGREPRGAEAETAVPKELLQTVGTRLATIPQDFTAHGKILRLMDSRMQMARGEKPIDWAMAEALAFGTLLWEGVLIRMSGQDSRRGTFSQRHAVIVDIKTGAEHVPLSALREGQGDMRLYDSSLSEAAVLGFEFGYSLDNPDALILWEAQFGDFINGAQVIIDQFICSSEDKWRRLSGLTMLLPHGFEGQGPEHSSARYERLLQCAAEDNIQVCQPTTPAQYFHMLRRQVLRRWRKPLFVLTPKSLLRLPACTSPISELTVGRFLRILDDPEAPPAEAVERVFVCTGKVFYEMAEERRKRGDQRTAIVRVEQIYPLDEERLEGAIARFPNARELVWVQEEPANMGAAFFMEPRMRRLSGGKKLRLVARPESGSPATGSAKAHALEQRALMEAAFGRAVQ